MRYNVTWEPEDIIPGRRYGRSGQASYMIICIAGISGEMKYASLDLESGESSVLMSQEELAANLTVLCYLPVELLELQPANKVVG